MSTILFAGDSYAVADPEHKHHGEIIAEHFGLKCKLEGIPFSDVQILVLRFFHHILFVLMLMFQKTS